MQKKLHHGLDNQRITISGKPTDIIMFETPSPASIIFVLPEGMGSGAGRTVTFTDWQKAVHPCPTAFQLLAQQRGALVQQVVVGSNPKDPTRDMITVTLHNPDLWRDPATLRTVQTVIWGHVAARLKGSPNPLVNFESLEAEKNFPQLVASFKAAGDPPSVAEHKAVIAVYNTATVGTHGGKIQYVGYDAKRRRLSVYFDSACSNCQSTDSTRRGLEAQFAKIFAARGISAEVCSIELVTQKPKGMHNA
ncbi:MAG: hypothetical protein EBQ96_07805 [Proteobacteria bacterium]|nr:hypothetical protein [Pseudomonadota bacterium]